MSPVLNFGAGPATLPVPVVEQAAAELGRRSRDGITIMEASHRGLDFSAVAEKAEADLRLLLGVPETHRVLFLQGGATAQFAGVPLNLAPEGASADHVVSGHWSRRAADEAARFCTVNVAADGAGSGYRSVPDPATWRRSPEAAYLAYCANDTIHGVEFHRPPDPGGPPLVADMSSTLLSRPLEVDRFGVIYAGAQKNLGPAGVTVVIVHTELLGRSGRAIPSVLDYRAMADSGSMLNTPPTFAWYVSGLVLAWLIAEGGLEEMESRNRRKQALLYDAIDGSSLYSNAVEPAWRSWMNVPFRLADPDLDAVFRDEASAAGLVGLEGHRSVGGMRASLYNAVPETAVRTLVEFMSDFERRHG